MLTGVHVPTDPTAALGLVLAGGVPLGGGTTLMPQLNDYASPPTELISLRHIGLDAVQADGAVVSIGAATTLSAVERSPSLHFLHPTVRSIASPPVRNLATVAGNLFTAQPHGDLAVALLALDAEVDFVDDNGPHTSSLENFLAHERGATLVVTQIRFAKPAEHTFRYLKAARRKLNSASIGTIAAIVHIEDERVADVRVALGGLAPRVVRAHAVEAALLGKRLDSESVVLAGRAGLDDIEPYDDAYASAWYRRRVFPVHLRRALLGNTAS